MYENWPATLSRTRRPREGLVGIPGYSCGPLLPRPGMAERWLAGAFFRWLVVAQQSEALPHSLQIQSAALLTFPRRIAVGSVSGALRFKRDNWARKGML